MASDERKEHARARPLDAQERVPRHFDRLMLIAIFCNGRVDHPSTSVLIPSGRAELRAL